MGSCAYNFSDDLAAVEDMGRLGFIDKTGNFVIEPQYKLTGSFSGGLCHVMFPSDNYYEWFIDKEGNKVHHIVIKDGYCEGLARITEFQKEGFINKEGKIVVDHRFLRARNFSDGLASVEVCRNRWGFVDKNGKLAIKADFHDASSFSEGLAAVNFRGRVGYIDKNGEFVIKPTFYGELEPFHNGLALIKTYDHCFGYINKTGKIVIEPQYYFAHNFSEGYAVVRNYERKCGVIDKFGKLIIDYIFDNAKSFKNGLLAVKLNNYWGYIKIK